MQYLSWLAEDEAERRWQRFDEMSKNWALGTRAFARGLAKDHTKLQDALKCGLQELAELGREDQEEMLATLFKSVGKEAAVVAKEPKGAAWKVAVAAEMKRRTTASNPWIAQRLAMRSPFRASRLVSAFRKMPGEAERFLRLCAKCKVRPLFPPLISKRCVGLMESRTRWSETGFTI